MARVARLGVVIDSSGAKKGAQETNTALQSIDNTAKRTVKELQKAAATLGVAFGLRGLQQAADQYVLLDARLRQVTRSGAEFARVQGQLFAIAQQSRASYTATIDLYTRLARSSDQLGISQSQLVSVTEAVSNAVRLSSASTGAAEAGLVQLGQAFASGTLRGDELRSIMEQLPAVAKAIADGLGVPIGKLREMGEAGELSGRKVALALDSQREKLALLAGEIPTTIGQALQQLNNAFGMVVLGSDQAKSATEGIAGSLGAAARFLVEYKDAVIAVSTALGVGGLAFAAAKATAALAGTAVGGGVIAFAKLIPLVTSTTTAFGLLQLGASAAWAAMTGPVGWFIAGMTAVAAAVYFWRKRQVEVTDAVKVTTKSAADLYAEAKKLAEANWAPSAQLQQIQNLGGALQAARTGGKAAVEAFRAASEQWKDTATVTRSFAQALAEGDQKAKTLLSTTQAQITLGTQVERTLDAQTKAQQAATKAAEERAAIERDYQAQIVQLGIELAERAAAAETERAAALRDGERALADLVAAGATNTANLRAEIAALVAGGDALRQYTAQQELNALITERLNQAKAAGLAITPQVLGAIVSEAAETQKLLRVREALKGVDIKDLFKLATGEAQQFSSAMTDTLGVARELAQVFGNFGSQLTRAVQLAVQMATAIRASRAADKARDSVLTDPNATAAQKTAATGAARSAGIAGGTAILTASITAIVGVTRAFQQAGEAAAEAAIALRNMRLQALQQAERFLGQSGSALDRTTAGITSQFNDVITGLLAAGAPRVDRLGSRTARSVVPTADTVNAVIDKYEELIAKAKEAAALQLQQAEGDLQVRQLAAQGRTAEADALRLQLTQAKERRDAEEEFGKNSPYLEYLKTVQAAETAAAQAAEARRQAEQAFDRGQFGLDLTQRRQTLTGDSRGAFIAGQTIANNSALAEAQKLVEAGVITAAMFEELKTLLGDEFTAALADFDAAVAASAAALAESKVQQQEDLEVRRLVALGMGAEAEKKRIEIANRRELLGVTDEALIAQIKQVQALEEEARVREAAAEAVRKATEQMQDLADRELEALRTLNPEKAKEIEQKRKLQAREEELAGAVNDAVRARMREIHALEDAAEAMQKLNRELEQAAKFAEEQATFTASLNSQYLRSQGRGFDADVNELNEWRTTQRKQAMQYGFGEGSEQWRMIDAVYASRYNTLVSSMMGGNSPIQTPELTPSATDTATILGEETTAVRSARSITESTALQLVDYAASQTALLRRLVQLAEGGSGATGNALVSPSLDLVDRTLGARASTASLLLAGSVR